jgi:hypothetical protein
MHLLQTSNASTSSTAQPLHMQHRACSASRRNLHDAVLGAVLCCLSTRFANMSLLLLLLLLPPLCRWQLR